MNLKSSFFYYQIDIGKALTYILRVTILLLTIYERYLSLIVIWVCINLVKRKNIESAINAASAQTIHVQVKDMDAAVDYSCSFSERINWSCINATFDIFFFWRFLLSAFFLSTKFMPFVTCFSQEIDRCRLPFMEHCLILSLLIPFIKHFLFNYCTYKRTTSS